MPNYGGTSQCEPLSETLITAILLGPEVYKGSLENMSINLSSEGTVQQTSPRHGEKTQCLVPGSQGT